MWKQYSIDPLDRNTTLFPPLPKRPLSKTFDIDYYAFHLTFLLEMERTENPSMHAVFDFAEEVYDLIGSLGNFNYEILPHKYFKFMIDVRRKETIITILNRLLKKHPEKIEWTCDDPLQKEKFILQFENGLYNFKDLHFFKDLLPLCFINSSENDDFEFEVSDFIVTKSDKEEWNYQLNQLGIRPFEKFKVSFSFGDGVVHGKNTFEEIYVHQIPRIKEYVMITAGDPFFRDFDEEDSKRNNIAETIPPRFWVIVSKQSFYQYSWSRDLKTASFES